MLEGFQDYLGDSVRILYSEGCHLHKSRIEALSGENDRISEVKGICGASDVVIACMGLDSGLEGEEGDEGNAYASGDKPDLNLPGLQEEVLKTIAESGKPAVLVLLSGSALAVSWADENIPAIIQAWYPGAQGGRAVAEAIFGEFCPEGRLPVTFYRSTEELPDFTDYSMKNRTYRYMEGEALYPFGYGLSYNDYSYSGLTCESCTISEEGADICVDVENKGTYTGNEAVQVYVKVHGSGTPNPQLKAVKKVALIPGEKKTVKLHLPRSLFLCLTMKEDGL